MQKQKIRKEKLSIYLARNSTDSDSKLIKINNTKKSISLELPECESVTLYIKKDLQLPPPPWTKLFTSFPQVSPTVFGSSSTVGAVLIIRIKSQTFILAFGMGFHLIKNEAIERDFGFRVTLNSVDPDYLRSLDKASYDHNPLNSRTQSSKGVNIFNLNIDSELDMLYAITGNSIVDIFGSHVTGRDALTIVVEEKIEGIPKILNETILRYKSKLPPKLEWVDNINRIRDKAIIENLDSCLDSQLKNSNFKELWLGEPEIVDWETQIGYSFSLNPRSPRPVLLTLNNYINYLKSKQRTLSVEALKSDSVYINNSEYQSIKNWSVFRCLYAELKVNDEQFILRNGIWYRVDTDFVKSVNQYIKNELNHYCYTFPKYNHDNEGEYNGSLSKKDSSFVLMDKKNIQIGGKFDKLEFCDFIRNGSEFIHVKYYRSSNTLSHLFSQGYVAAEAFVKDLEFREKLNPKLPTSIQLPDPKKRPNPANYKVVYAIATEKKLPDELPFFSKVTLKNALKILLALNYKVELSQIGVDRNILIKNKCKSNAKKQIS